MTEKEKQALPAEAGNATTPGPAGPATAGIKDAAGTGAFAGAVAGLAAHYLADGRLTLPIFLVVSIVLLGNLKGAGKVVGLVVFTLVAALVVTVFKE